MNRAAWWRRITVAASGLSFCLVGLAENPDDRLRALAAAADQGDPLVRIGLNEGHRLRLSSRSAFRILDLRTGQAVWRKDFTGELLAVAEGGPEQGARRIYRVQVGAFSTREAAETELRRLDDQFGVGGVVRHNPDRGNWRVRLGGEPDRLSLNPLMERLRAQGAEGLWIAEEPLEQAGAVGIRLVDASYESHASDAPRMVVVPAAGAHIEVEGRPYRGVIELRVTDFGTLRAINWVEIEHYLLGVVPAELGPEVWPELQALQAQAVAARTYVFHNLGQFGDQGFDLCAEPRCQVYSGAAAEHPLSDRAVWGTRGEILTYEGEPIIALFSATCGGHTENGGAIFVDSDRPYLTGVPCRAENEALASLRATVSGAAVEPLHDETGADVTRDWLLLRAAGVLGNEAVGELSKPLAESTLRRWTTGLAQAAGLPAPEGGPGATDTLGSAAASLLRDLRWNERGRVLLSRADLPALVRDEDVDRLPDEEQRALAYLVWVEGLNAHPDGRLGASAAPTAARMISALARIAESYDAFHLRDGVVSGMGKSSVRLVQGKGEIRLPLAQSPYLLGLTGGRSVSVEQLQIWPGDRVRFRTGETGAVDLLELAPPVKGVSDDRSAAVYSWETRRTRREVEAAINRRISIGRLQDLEILRRGVSGRVTEMRVVGSAGSTVVRGFDIRRLLDLRDILTVIEVQRDADGKIEALVFAGKGWGHGVGLCQVGAYGMALRGADYREILTHYYRGAKLQKLD